MSGGRVDGGEESLAASMAAAENRCAECLIWKQKLTNESNRSRQASDKIARLERDITSANSTTDAVIAKWTAHVKLIMEEREAAEAKLKQPTSPPGGGTTEVLYTQRDSCSSYVIAASSG